jgi:hypothetical protein
LEVDLRPIDNQGNWTLNTQYKARFIADMIEKYWGRSIVYTDADSRFLSYPALFESLDCDLAAHHFTNRRGDVELLSGTLYLRCNEATRELARIWIAECERNPKSWDQWALESALKLWRGLFQELPQEYCSIFDAHNRPAQPVIEHLQSSRRLKNA